MATAAIVWAMYMFFGFPSPQVCHLEFTFYVSSFRHFGD